MLYEKGGYWVDSDMIALKKPLRFKEEPYIFSSERTIQKGHKVRTQTEIVTKEFSKFLLRVRFIKNYLKDVLLRKKKVLKKIYNL